MSDSTIEVLLEELINLQASSPAFRSLFRSQSNTQSFIETFRTFVEDVAKCTSLNDRVTRIQEKVSHFALTIACDAEVSGHQKQEASNVLDGHITNKLNSLDRYLKFFAR